MVLARSTRCPTACSPPWKPFASAKPPSPPTSSLVGNAYQASSAVHGDQLTGLDPVSRVGHTNDSGDAIFTRHHGTMRVRATHLHDKAAGCQEKGSPSGIGGGRNQDFPRLEMGTHRVEHYSCWPCHGASRRGTAGERSRDV